MTALPPASDFTDSTVTEGQFKTAMTSLRAYLSGLFGTDGTAATARAALGAGTLSNVAEDTTPQLGGAFDTNAFAIDESEGTAVASAASPNIWVPDGNTLHLTGSVTITGFAAAPRAGAWRKLIIDAAPLFTNGANLIVEGNADFQAAAGDIAFVYAETTTQFRVFFKKADGTAVSAGKVVQIVNFQTGAVATGTTILPFDDTIPQNTEGDEYMTLTITPTNTNNRLLIEVQAFIASSASQVGRTVALFQDSTADALAVIAESEFHADISGILSLTHEMAAGTVSATTFKIRMGSTVAATFTFNGQAGAAKFGGKLASSITITEYLS